MATPAVGDIDGDGEMNRRHTRCEPAWNLDGTRSRRRWRPATTASSTCVRRPLVLCLSSPALFDVDGDGGADIIFGSRYGWSADNMLYAVKADGTDAAGFPYNVGTGANILCSPTVADFNSDGVWEITFISRTISSTSSSPTVRITPDSRSPSPRKTGIFPAPARRSATSTTTASWNSA